MISMRRTLLPGTLAALWFGSLWRGNPCAADPPPCNSPASYRLFNPSTMGPRLPGCCGRNEPIPCCNPGRPLDNPRGTGMDDPWRPPQVWPQTRYPVVPAYTRPSYGYYETSWRVLPLCNREPAIAGPIYPAGWQSNQPGAPLQPPQPVPEQGPLPRPPVVPPAVQAAPEGPPVATPPAAVPPGGRPTTVPGVPLQPQKAMPPTNELQPPPKATPPAPAPGLRGLNQGAIPPEPMPRSAMLELRGDDAPEIRVQPF
jgi:hypothetical protein